MNCLIIDDEQISRRGMSRLVANDQRLRLDAVFSSAEEAKAYLEKNVVDLIFLDIEMDGQSGLDFARTIPPSTLVVFVTAYSEYAVESYAVDAIDYLVKPVDPERFRKAVDKAVDYHWLINRADNSPESYPPRADVDYLIVKADRRYYRIPFGDIRLVEGLGDYLIIQTSARRVVTRMTIKSIAEALPSEAFVRVNKSVIVPVALIDSFDTNDVFVGDREIAIGPAYRESVIARLLQ